MIPEKLKKEDGMLIVEATIIFPIMFLVIFLMMFMGNAYFHKSTIDSTVAQMANYGAAQCADPLLREINDKGGVPSLKNSSYSIEPYRYLFGELGSKAGMSNIETNVKKQINDKIKNMKTGMFSHMKPSASSVTAEFNNAFIYSTFEVEVNYELPLPIRIIGMKDYFKIYASSRCEVPVSDVPEFIRNINMIMDWIENTKGGQDALNKVDEVMSKVGKIIN